MNIEMPIAARRAAGRAAKAGLLALELLLLAACGGPAPDAAQAAPASSSAIDPCALLTKDDIAAALQLPLDKATQISLPRPNCRYDIGDGAVVVYVFSDASAKLGFAAGRKAQSLGTVPVSGVGNDAYWSPELQVLNVLKGERYFTVQFLSLAPGSLEAAMALARRAAERLS